MGIKGLGSFLRKQNVGAIKIDPEKYRGSTIAVDGNLIIFRFIHSSLNIKEALIKLYNFLIYRTREYDINFLIVFDHPRNKIQKKSKTIEKRIKAFERSKERTNIIINNLKLEKKKIQENDTVLDHKKIENINYQINQKRKLIMPVGKIELITSMCFLAINGFDVIMSSGDGDKLLARLYHSGYVDAILSKDTDFLPFGVNDLIIDFGKKEIEVYILSNILSGLNITLKKFVRMCVLSGSDFSKLPGCGLVTAFKHMNSMETISEIDDSFCEECTNYLFTIDYFTSLNQLDIENIEDFKVFVPTKIEQILLSKDLIPKINVTY